MQRRRVDEEDVIVGSDPTGLALHHLTIALGRSRVVPGQRDPSGERLVIRLPALGGLAVFPTLMRAWVSVGARPSASPPMVLEMNAAAHRARIGDVVANPAGGPIFEAASVTSSNQPCIGQPGFVRMHPPLSSAPTQDAVHRREQIATRLTFFIAGFSTGAWAPLVPLARERLQLDEGSLGVAPSVPGTGSITAMPGLRGF